MYSERLSETLPRVRDMIAEAELRAGRAPDSVRLVAVTKTHPLEAVRAALDAGLHDLGENRVEELVTKAAALGDDRVRWHMIGHLQRRKAPDVIGIADLVHSVDTLRLAERLSSKTGPEGVSVLVQVNTSGEDAKSGFDPGAAEQGVLAVAALPGLRVEGLMTMAPFVDDEAILRPCFSRLRELLDAVRRQDESIGEILSMGMTNDLGLAIEEGSTMVRIGTALFGARPTPT